MKGFDKIAFIIKTTGNSGIADRDIFGGKHFAGAFNPVIVQVIDGGPSGHAAEIPAEIFWIHPCDFSQCVQADIMTVIFRDKREDFFEGIQPSRLRQIFRIVFIKLLLQDNAEKLIQTALRHEFVACPPACKSRGQILNNGKNQRTVTGEKRLYDDSVIHNILYGFCAGVVVLHQDLKIENDTVIDTGVILRASAMKNAI